MIDTDAKLATFRGYAAEALGNVKDKDSLEPLKTSLAVEPLPWVREKMEEAIKKIQGA